MERLAAVIRATASRSERAARYHAGAAQRIDAAIYELEQLRAEIATVLQAGLRQHSDTARLQAAAV